MTVRAKFVCFVKAETVGRNFDIELLPVVDSDPDSENGRFYKSTPSGSIKLATINEKAAAQFVPGNEYYVDFTSAE